ncbi:MAG: ATP-binding cassette domain-containing protein [Pseudomonadota bacterium]
MPTQPEVSVRGVSFRYETAADPLITDLTASFPAGFTGIVGANGSGKTTLLGLLTGQLEADSGEIAGIGNAVRCEQRTDAAPPDLAGFLDDWDHEAIELRRRLAVEPDFLVRWDTLSHGERKRAQLAHALWQKPDVLAIDEPTNHIDRTARDLLLDSLRRFRGVGLLVSHDRALLDELCVQCLWLSPPVVKVFPGGYTETREQLRVDRDVAVRERQKAQREQKKLGREAARRRQTAANEHRARSKRGLGANDSDARDRINRARVSDGKAGKPLRQLDGRMAQAAARVAAARVKKQHETSFWLPGSRSQRRLLLDLPPSRIGLAPGRTLTTPALQLRPDDRIAITGANGLGKSTLIRHVLPALNAPEERVILLPQELSADDAGVVLAGARKLPQDELGLVMQIFSRLGSRPGRLLESRLPSPGEVRKLLLALGVARAPHLLVMDEPTNHLDLPSIEALEDALDACPCAMLLVSHDERFLARLGVRQWVITAGGAGNATLSIP